jgi:hypothetical protein
VDDEEEMAVAVVTLKPVERDPSYPSVAERDANPESAW